MQCTPDGAIWSDEAAWSDGAGCTIAVATIMGVSAAVRAAEAATEVGDGLAPLKSCRKIDGMILKLQTGYGTQ